MAATGAGDVLDGSVAIANARFEADMCFAGDDAVLRDLERGVRRFLLLAMRPLVDCTMDQEFFVDLVRKITKQDPSRRSILGTKEILGVLESSPVIRKLSAEIPSSKFSVAVRDSAAFVITTEAVGNCQFVAVASALAMREAAEYSRKVVAEGKPLVMPRRLRDITGVSEGSRLAAKVLRRVAVEYLGSPEAPDDVKMFLDVTTAQLGSPDGPDPSEDEVASRREDYLRRMSRDTVWGDELTLLALSNVCNVVIEVYRHTGKYQPDRMPEQPKLQRISCVSPFTRNQETRTIRLLWDGRIVQGVEHAHYMPLVSAADRWAIPTSYSMSHSEVQAVADRIGFSAAAVDDISAPEKDHAATLPAEFFDSVECALARTLTTKAREALAMVFGAMLSRVAYTTARFARHNFAGFAGDRAEGWSGGYTSRVKVTKFDVAQALVLHAQVIEMEIKKGTYRNEYKLSGPMLRSIHSLSAPPGDDAREILAFGGTDQERD